MISTGAMADRVARAQAHLGRCRLCEHRCDANRVGGERGPCKADSAARVFRQRVEFGEEQELIPSHLFYLSGCDLRCKFCIAEKNAFNPKIGAPLSPEFLSQSLLAGAKHRPRTLQWVGGEPTIHIPAILATIKEVEEAGEIVLPPIVWKSDFYGTPEAFELLDGVAEIYVADFKFGQNDCAARIAGVDRYFETVTRNFRIAAAQGDLIIRHLLLPGHFDCCFRPLVRWIADHLPKAKFSLRDGFLPRWQAHHDDDLCQTLDPKTARAARRLAEEHQLNLIR